MGSDQTYHLLDFGSFTSKTSKSTCVDVERSDRLTLTISPHCCSQNLMPIRDYARRRRFEDLPVIMCSMHIQYGVYDNICRPHDFS